MAELAKESVPVVRAQHARENDSPQRLTPRPARASHSRQTGGPAETPEHEPHEHDPPSAASRVSRFARAVVQRRLVWLAVFTGSAAVVATWLAQDRLASLPQLRTVRVEQGELRITVGATGTIEPEEIVQVGPDVQGKIVRFGNDPENPENRIQVGSRVSPGSVLLEIDRDTYQIALEQAQVAHRLAAADLARLEIQLKQAALERQRAERLRSTNAQSDYDRVVTAHEIAQAQVRIGQGGVDKAAVALKQAQRDLDRTLIRSPIEGVVIDVRANLGQHVHAGQPGMFLLAKNVDRMRIRAAVSESDVGKIQAGQQVRFTVDAFRDRQLTGQVTEVLMNARTQGNFVTYDALIAIDETDARLFPHMTADVEFEIIRRTDAWLVPNAAIQWQPENGQVEPESQPEPPVAGEPGRFVWTPTSGGHVRPLPVRVGISDGVVTEVVGDGFQDGLPVVVGVVTRASLARIIPSAKTVR